MIRPSRFGAAAALLILPIAAIGIYLLRTTTPAQVERDGVTVRHAAAWDVSPPLALLQDPGGAAQPAECEEPDGRCGMAPDDQGGAGADAAPRPPVTPAATAVEQKAQGARPAAILLESFDGHGVGLVGPHGSRAGGNPSDNSMAVGRNHIVETVNGGGIAIYTKKGELYDKSGTVLFGPIGANVLFSGFGGECERSPNGDFVVRYDQLADRWLYVMPLFRRAVAVPAGDTIAPYGMCYAVSAGTNPLGPYYRYYFERELFPDYPRPAIWPDGYYVPTSTGDNLLPNGQLPEKHACVIERSKMLLGQPAREQCIIIRDVNFLNNADIDGWGLPPAGAPNIMIATGGAQLRDDFEDDGIYYWKMHVDWENPANTKAVGPVKIPVAQYNYLCNGQLTRCVPQPETDTRVDSQGDKIMQRVVYRNIDGTESIVAVHSVNTASGGGGVRWYEFRMNPSGDPVLHQQGTYAPDGLYRWMASPGIDRQGNIGIGYSFGGLPHYIGQRFAARLADDPKGQLTFHETVLVEGAASQTPATRWEDYTQLSMDPDDDCTFWYVGDYLKAGARTYTTKIGAFRLPGCMRGTVNGTVYFDRNRNGMREPNEPGLQGWQVEYAGVRAQQGRTQPPSGTLTSDSIGDYKTWLPADPAYFDPSYTISARSATNPTWTRIENGNAYWEGGTIAMANRTYTVRLRDRDDVTYLNFGNVCTVKNAGGMAATHWLGDGRAVLSSNDQPPIDPATRGGRGGRGGRRGGGAAGWRNLLNSTPFLVNADGSRFQVTAGTFDEAYAPFRAWLSGGSGQNTSYLASIQLATTTLNVTWGTQDGNATVHDPIANDWPSVSALLTRVSTFIEAHPNTSQPSADRTTAEAYRKLLEELNTNAATVTPASPASCARPF